MDDPIMILPLLPLLADPVLRLIIPLTPFVPAFAVVMVNDPVELAVPPPEVMVIAPPVPVPERPAVMVT